MNIVLSALMAGLLFGAGLVISGMTCADKVINFLDLADNWDPSLMFVMVGAIAVHLTLYRLILRRPSPLFAEQFGIPSASHVDGRLLAGAGLFGVGWALGGYCPGPSLVSLAALTTDSLAFVAAMTIGMLVQHTLMPAPTSS